LAGVKANLLPRETDSLGEWEKDAARRLLAKSFKAMELEYLQQHPQFQKAVAEMQTFDAFERTTYLGNRLLVERDERSTPFGIVQNRA
jgi:hypothetical protein